MTPNIRPWRALGLLAIITIALLALFGCSTIRCSSPTVIERTTDIGDDNISPIQRAEAH